MLKKEEKDVVPNSPLAFTPPKYTTQFSKQSMKSGQSGQFSRQSSTTSTASTWLFNWGSIGQLSDGTVQSGKLFTICRK